MRFRNMTDAIKYLAKFGVIVDDNKSIHGWKGHGLKVLGACDYLVNYFKYSLARLG